MSDILTAIAVIPRARGKKNYSDSRFDNPVVNRAAALARLADGDGAK